MDRCASRNSSKAFATGDLTLTVAGGAPVRVYGIWLGNRSGGILAFTIKDGAGVTIQVVEVLDGTTTELGTEFIADAGLAITAAAGSTDATVFHSSPGT